jgi:hypothetical protein
VRLRIVAEPDELKRRAEDVVRVVGRLAGRDFLAKADRPVKLDSWQVLYVPPNPDGTRKRCANCPLWRDVSRRCLIHKASQEVTADHVCGYHFYGKPYVDVPSGAEHTEPLSAEVTGLEEVRGGVSCDKCSYFGNGYCSLLSQSVHPMACCSGWTPAGELQKAEALPDKQIRQTAAQFEYKVLETAVERSKKYVEKVRKRMLSQIDQALQG